MRLAISLVCLSALAASPGLAQRSEADLARAPFEECGRITDDGQRLACFDRALRETNADRERRLAEQREAEELEKRKQFGLEGSPAEKVQRAEQPPEQRPVEVERVEVQVVSATVDGIGRWTINMSDGSAWRQIETVPTFQSPRKGQTVSVRKGMLGSYLLRVGSQPFTRVVRVK
jgi:hypothetical protein